MLRACVHTGYCAGHRSLDRRRPPPGHPPLPRPGDGGSHRILGKWRAAAEAWLCCGACCGGGGGGGCGFLEQVDGGDGCVGGWVYLEKKKIIKIPVKPLQGN